MVLVIISLFGIIYFGLKPSIDFTGGTILEVEFASGLPEKTFIIDTLNTSNIINAEVRSTGEHGYIIKMGTIDDVLKEELVNKMAIDGVAPEIIRFNTIGPTLGNELKTKALASLLIVVVAIVLFIAYTFRAVSKPVSSTKYGAVAVIALVHDIIITVGVFSFLGYFYGIEVDTLFITALLVILGYSINDTIVVLDRVRENLKDKTDEVRDKNFVSIVDTSLRETFVRSINTSFTTILALIALFIFGGDATHNFTLALIIGIVSGTYSSVFLAAPMLVSFKKIQDNKIKKIATK